MSNENDNLREKLIAEINEYYTGDTALTVNAIAYREVLERNKKYAFNFIDNSLHPEESGRKPQLHVIANMETVKAMYEIEAAFKPFNEKLPDNSKFIATAKIFALVNEYVKKNFVGGGRGEDTTIPQALRDLYAAEEQSLSKYKLD